MACPRSPIKNLDDLPKPAREMFNLDLYRPHPPYGRKWRYMNEITSRGCPFQCAYCSKSVFGSTFRAMSPDRVVSDIVELVERYDVREIHFYDDDFTLKRERAFEIFEKLARADTKVIWSCTTRCDLVDPELLRLMKRAGCWMISYGVESGNDRLLQIIRKGISKTTIEKAFYATKKAGLKVTGYFMVGLPGETEETLAETLAFAEKLRPNYVNWAVMSVYPGSSFHSEILQGKYGPGRLLDGGKKSFTPFQDNFLLSFEGQLTRDRMEEFVRQATRGFYFNPCNILRIITDIRSISQLYNIVKTGFGIFAWMASPKK